MASVIANLTFKVKVRNLREFQTEQSKALLSALTHKAKVGNSGCHHASAGFIG